MNESDYDPLSRCGGLGEAKRLKCNPHKKPSRKNRRPIEVDAWSKKLLLAWHQQHNQSYFLHGTEPKSSNLRHDYHSTSRHKINPHGKSKKKPQVQFQKEEYRENVVIQLERITSEKPINVKDGKVTNFSILATR